MPYCTVDDMIAEFTEAELIQLTDADCAGVVNTVTLDKAISRADRTINRYLGRFATLPVAVDLVTDLACDIARYFLYTGDVPDLIKQRYEQAIKYLEQIAQGKIDLTDSSGASAAPTVGGAQMTSSASVFGRDNSY